MAAECKRCAIARQMANVIYNVKQTGDWERRHPLLVQLQEQFDSTPASVVVDPSPHMSAGATNYAPNRCPLKDSAGDQCWCVLGHDGACVVQQPPSAKCRHGYGGPCVWCVAESSDRAENAISDITAQALLDLTHEYNAEKARTDAAARERDEAHQRANALDERRIALLDESNRGWATAEKNRQCIAELEAALRAERIEGQTYCKAMEYGDIIRHNARIDAALSAPVTTNSAEVSSKLVLGIVQPATATIAVAAEKMVQWKCEKCLLPTSKDPCAWCGKKREVSAAPPSPAAREATKCANCGRSGCPYGDGDATDMAKEECERARAGLVEGEFDCPICGKNYPHEHSGEDIARHRGRDIAATPSPAAAKCTNESGCLEEKNGARNAPCAYACERETK